jgi:O-antigen/teichoic acid export membrane protein
LSSYNNALSGIQNAARQRGVVAFHRGLDAWLKILLAVGVIRWLGTSSTSVLLGYAFSSLLVTCSQFIFLRRLISNQNKFYNSGVAWIRQMWKYSWPFSAWGTFTWLQQSSDRWSLKTFSTSQEVGLYAVLFQLGYAPISVITDMIVSFFGPILFERSGDATDSDRIDSVHRLTWRITLCGLILSLLGFLVTLGIHSWLFRFLVSREFAGVSYLLPWMVLAGGFFAVGQILALKLASEIRTAAMIRVKIVTAILGILLNFYGAHFAGLNGVIFAVVAFSTIYLLWMIRLSIHRTSGTNELSTYS